MSFWVLFGPGGSLSALLGTFWGDFGPTWALLGDFWTKILRKCVFYHFNAPLQPFAWLGGLGVPSWSKVVPKGASWGPF